MLVSTVNTSGLVNETQNRKTYCEAGFTFSDFSFRVIKSIAWDGESTSNPMFEFLIDFALTHFIAENKQDATLQMKHLLT